jgi:hypothetical protein
MSAAIGPRTTAIRHLLGETITDAELVTDESPWGRFADDDPLKYRAPELWVHKIHDACGGVE